MNPAEAPPPYHPLTHNLTALYYRQELELEVLRAQLLQSQGLLEEATRARSYAERRMDRAVRRRTAAEQQVRAFSDICRHLRQENERLARRESDLSTRLLLDAEKHAAQQHRLRLECEARLHELQNQIDEQQRARLQREAPPPLFIPSYIPRSFAEWIMFYDNRWREVLSGSDQNLSVSHFPWPACFFVRHIQDLDEEEVKEFFSRRYQNEPGAWKEDVRRWHPDKFATLRERVAPMAKKHVEVGFAICIRAMLWARARIGSSSSSEFGRV